jgi:hypothetical protein
VADLYKCRNCKSLLLFLWVLGTFFFAGFVNWAVNGRSILPMAPAVGILLVRAFDRKGKTCRQIKGWRVRGPLILTAIVALSVCWADYTLAGTARDAAKTICQAYRNRPTVLWFQGHWGFQYYMEANNARPLDFENSELYIGDIIVIPINNTYLRALLKERTFLVQVLKFIPCRWLSTMSPLLGAGFYSSVLWGPVPFAFGRVPAEEYYIFVFK